MLGWVSTKLDLHHLRAPFSLAHQLARRDVPLALGEGARSTRLIKGAARARYSQNEHGPSCAFCEPGSVALPPILLRPRLREHRRQRATLLSALRS